MRRAFQARKLQRGMALIVSLVILVSMTLLALAAIQNTSLEERMAGNLRAEKMAFQAAEAALRSGESWLAALELQPTVVPDRSVPNPATEVWAEGLIDDTGNATGPYSVIDSPEGQLAWWLQWTDTLWQSSAVPVDVTQVPLVYVSGTDGGTEEKLGVERAPQFVVEEAGYLRDHLVIGQQRDLSTSRIQYRVTARGRDAGGRGETLISSVYARRY
jgi:Tfp pilus assembly protein PilX